ncbi:hypothetical protein ACVWY2_009557 [Bradyrhizobium sp. JR6.1]
MKQRGPVNLATALTVGSSLRPFDAAAAWSLDSRQAARNIAPDHALALRRGAAIAGISGTLSNEVAMATERHGQITETPTEARQAEPGPSVLALLTASTGLAVLILGIIWFAFFRV